MRFGVPWVLAAVFIGTIILAACPALGQDGFVTIQGDQFIWKGQVVKMKGTNYYPRDHMWADIWNNWDWNQMLAETTMVSNLGMNCVRILVPYRAGGWGGANPPSDRLQKLEDLVNLFGSKGVRSCVTLFDWETSFPAPGTSTERDHLSYLSAIVNRLKYNANVFMWDVKNEPDHPANIGGGDNWDFNPAARDKIVSWLHRMCNAVRAIDPNHPVSAGLRWWQNVKDVVAFEDVAIFHSYWPNVAQEIIDTRSYMGSNQKPILCEEFGWPTNPNPCYRDGRLIYDYNEAAQLDLYVNHLNAFTAYNTAGCIQWMTFDARPYTSDQNESFEKFFGLWRYDYSLKPAGAYYRDHFPVTQFHGPDTTPPGPVTAFTALGSDGANILKWTNPADGDVKGVLVRCRTDRYPTSVTDGAPVCDRTASPGTQDSFTHAGLTNGLTYYYSAFAYDTAPNYSGAANASAAPRKITCADVKRLVDMSVVDLAGKVVSAVFPSDACVYVQEADRTSGIRVVTSIVDLAPGDVVTVSGTMRTRILSSYAAERQILATNIVKTASGKAPGPLEMVCRSVGGGPAGALAPGVAGGFGVNNMGLLVKVAGKVTSKVTSYFCVDDTSGGIADPSGPAVVMVKCPSAPNVNVGDFVSVAGVVEGSIPLGWTSNRRLIHIRDFSDITRY